MPDAVADLSEIVREAIIGYLMFFTGPTNAHLELARMLGEEAASTRMRAFNALLALVLRGMSAPTTSGRFGTRTRAHRGL
jgi:hypothetical protein